MNRILFSLFFTVISITCQSQTDNFTEISADRPGMATPPFIVKHGIIQIETGFSDEKIKSLNSYQETILYSSFLLRYGILRNTEIRLQTDYATVETDSQRITGFNPAIIGTKILLLNPNKIRPKTSLLLNLTLPWFGGKDFRPEKLASSIYLLMQNDIDNKMNICYNIGIEYDGSGSQPSVFAALCFGYNFTDRLSGFGESYNWFSKSIKPGNFIDCGFAYLISRNIQLDVSGNINLKDIENYYMLGFGLSWRILK